MNDVPMQSVVVFSVRGLGHLQVLLPLIRGMSERGVLVHVMTSDEHRARVERSGARFFDLFARYPLEAADARSLPIPARYVTFAGVYAESLTADVAALAPSLVVYDTFSVVAPVVARRLGLPYVNVCPNHAPVPARALAELRDDPRVSIAPECRAAVRRLQDEHGWSTANPFSYMETLSPFLNVYPEPEEFLPAEDRSVFEPIAFAGSLAPELRGGAAAGVFPAERRGARVLAAFGTLIWRYYADAAYAALSALARACVDLEVDAVFGLGGYDLEASARASLAGPNVQVLDYVDQWAALGEADVFVTHHGINSTHEAIFHQVPMISYPFFGDQPALARRCQELGLAMPLAGAPRAALDRESARSVLAGVIGDRERFAARLAEARSWELRTIAGRGAVIERILALT